MHQPGSRNPLGMSRVKAILCGLFTIAHCLLFSTTVGSNVAPCPIGWLSYQSQNTCLYVSDSTTSNLLSAHEDCVKKNASLITIQSEEKMQFLKDIIQRYLTSNTYVWIGQQRIEDKVTWLTKDGSILADSLPREMRFTSWERNSYNYQRQGLVYKSNYLRRYSDVGGSPRFICEKRSTCNGGWYGLKCDKECHCHGQTCGGSNPDVTCHYGCQIGWMGPGCSRRKEDADVRYFCVNSQDQGKYAYVRIDTKGVTYANIHALDNTSHIMPWCNNTIVQSNKAESTVTIKIYTDNSSDQAIQEGSCAGKIDGLGKYEWKIKIQENDGIVSRNDKEVLLECDFSKGDALQLSGDTEIKRESWFRQSNIKKPVEHLTEKKEKVELFVADPYTGDRLSKTEIGSPVVLRINYGIETDNAATGVLPHNCYASSTDDEQRIMFMNDKSCPVEGFPISEFSRNGTAKSLITKPFPLFGFDGTEGVDFHCSYTPCFGDDPCLASCDDAQNATGTRNRRSVRNKPHIIKGTIGVFKERK